MNTETERPEAAGAGPEADLDALKAMARTYGPRLALGAGVVLLAFAGTWAYKNHKAGAVRRAAELLASAQTMQDLETVAERYAETPAAPAALIRLAKAAYDMGRYDAAFERYEDFVARYAQHPLADVAALGKLHCLEARGQLEEALRGFDAFMEAHPGHYLYPQAVFGKARCLEQLGRPDEARIVYEDYIAAYPGSGWASRAEDLLGSMERRIAFGSGGAASWIPAEDQPVFEAFPAPAQSDE
ncbi:MAG: tetratricopeptide repeat protein [Lentisphaerae bacterium]|nr:tetratricopeptide repeat protein [Lentisphaerota bacterium]